MTATDKEEVKIISDMHKAAGRKYTLGIEGLISPLRFNPVIFDTYFDWCDDKEIEMGVMGGIPMAGTTAPLPYPANLILALAEAIALDYIMQALSDGKIQFFGLRLELADMRTANLSYGSPEHCLLIQTVQELQEGLLGFAGSGGCFRTNGKIVEAQSILEHSLSFIWQAALGKRKFSSVGQMSVDEVYSPVMAVIDGEILRYGQRLLQSMEAGRHDFDPVELIREGIEEGNFLTHETTVSTFRSLFDLESMREASFLSAWRDGGSKTLEQKAWEKAEGIIKSYTFTPSPEAKRDLDALYAYAQKKFS